MEAGFALQQGLLLLQQQTPSKGLGWAAHCAGLINEL